MSTQADKAAATALRAMLAGDPPGGLDPTACGPWAEVVAALIETHRTRGTQAVRQVLKTLARTIPGLAELASADPTPRQTRWTVPELLTTDFPEPKWAVPGIIPVGLSILAGRPKVGKSWLALQIAHAVGTGGIALGQKVETGSVLFLALEDSPRRLKERLTKQSVPSSATITFQTEWRLLSDGGLADLQSEIEREGHRLVVVDTFSRAVGRADQHDVSEMTVLVGRLQQMALIYDLAILANDHHRKAAGFASDPIDDILGSTAKSAVGDAALGLYKEAGKRGAILRVTGRDIEERELALQWDAQTFCWQCMGDAGQVQKDSFKAEVLQAIGELTAMGESPTTTNVAAHLSKDRGQVSRTLADLLGDGRVLKLPKSGKEQPYSLFEGIPVKAVG